MLFWKIGLDMPQLAHVALPRGSSICIMFCALATHPVRVAALPLAWCERCALFSFCASWTHAFFAIFCEQRLPVDGVAAEVSQKKVPANASAPQRSQSMIRPRQHHMQYTIAAWLSIYLASRTTCTFLSATEPCQPSLSLSLYRLGDRRSHSHMLMHCFSCQHAQKIWNDKLWCWLSCRIMHWISLIFSLMLCTPISQSPQHRAVEAALSSSKIAFTLQIASLQRLYRSFCPVWFCTYFASTRIYHGNMTLQCPGVGGRGRSPLICYIYIISYYVIRILWYVETLKHSCGSTVVVYPILCKMSIPPMPNYKGLRNHLPNPTWAWAPSKELSSPSFGGDQMLSPGKPVCGLTLASGFLGPG